MWCDSFARADWLIAICYLSLGDILIKCTQSVGVYSYSPTVTLLVSELVLGF